MTLGDKIKKRPYPDLSYDGMAGPGLVGTVVYIHPEGRFYTLEFISSVTGESFRQAYPLTGREKIELEEQRREDNRNSEPEGRNREDGHRRKLRTVFSNGL